MINSSLRVFACRVQAAQRISLSDVQHLQRDVLPDGISSREEAELLLALDQAVSRADRSFGDWLAAMLVDFVVWGTRPTGSIDADTAAWLVRFVASPKLTRTMRRLAQELAREAEHLNVELLSPSLNRAAQPVGSAWANLASMPLAA